MSCKATNTEELINIVQAGKALYNTKKNQSQQDTVNNLQHTQDNFEKIQSKYTIKDTTVQLATTITTEISKKYNAKFNRKETEESIKNLNTRASIGTMIHSVNEHITKLIYNTIKDKSVAEAMAYLASMDYNTYEASVKSFVNQLKQDDPRIKDVNFNNINQLKSLFEGSRETLQQIYSQQSYINKRLKTDGVPVLLMEQILIDPKTNIGGTADLIAIFSDNTAAVYDYKTKIPYQKYVDKDGKIMSSSYMTYNDKEKYKKQLGTIARILEKNYGVSKVVKSRIIPIQINAKFNGATSLLSNSIDDIYYGVKQNEFLNQYAPIPELTGFKDLDEFLKHIDKNIKNLENKIKSDKINRESLREQLEALENSRQSILTRHSFNDLLDYANTLLEKSTKDNLEKMSIEELRFIKDQLSSLTLLARSTYEYRQALDPDTHKEIIKDIEVTVQALSTEISDRLQDVEQELYYNRVANTVKQLTGYSILDQSGRLIPFNEEGFTGKIFNQLSQFDNPIFKTYRKLLDDAQYESKKNTLEAIDNIVEIDNNLRNWMKKNGKDEAWFVKTFINTDPKSPNVDNLHHKLSKEFIESTKKLKDTKDVNEIINMYKPLENYENYYTESYNRELEKLNKRFENNQDKIDYFMNQWINENDLSLKDGKPVHPDAWLNYYMKDKLQLKQETIAKNYSPEYQYINSIPELKAYYDMFESYNSKFRKLLGVEYFKLPNSFLPNIRKSNIDRLMDNGMIKGTKEVFNNLMEELDVREDDMMFGELDENLEGLKKTIPRFYLNPFKDKDGNVIVGEKSYDLTKSLILFSKMAFNYEQMNRIEGTVLAMRDLLSEKAEQFIKRGDNVLRDSLVGTELAAKIKGKDIEKIFESFVDMYLYGVSIQPISEDSSGKFEKLIMEAKQYYTLKALGLGFIPAAGSFIAAKTQAAIEGMKGQIYTKDQYKKAMTYAYKDREKFLALTAFFDPMDIKYQFFAVDPKGSSFGDPRERNKIKKYVNSRMLLRAFSAGDEFIDEVILAAMAQNFYIDDDGAVRRMRSDEDREQYKDRSVWNLFDYKDGEAKLKIPEDQVKEVIKTIKSAAQAAQSKIKGVIPDSDKAYWQSQIVGQVVMHFKSWMPGLLRERFGKEKYNDALQMLDMGRVVAFRREMYTDDKLAFGEYMSTILLPKMIELGKHLVWYNGSKNNPRIRLAYDNWINNNPQYKDKVSFDDYLEAQQSQMKSLIIELRILLTFALIIALLGADFDDDGKKMYQEMWATRKVAAIIGKVNQELSFSYNPKEFAKMIANPIPTAGLLVDGIKAISNTYDTTIDLTLGQKFPLPFHKPQEQDKTGMLYYSSRFIPGGYHIGKLFEIFDEKDPFQ
jgi:hypothetical protein